MDYEEFLEKVRATLEDEPEGLSWSQVRTKAGLPQKAPNNKWVRRLERDLGLKRSLVSGKGTIWRLR